MSCILKTVYAIFFFCFTFPPTVPAYQHITCNRRQHLMLSCSSQAVDALFSRGVTIETLPQWAMLLPIEFSNKRRWVLWLCKATFRVNCLVVSSWSKPKVLAFKISCVLSSAYNTITEHYIYDRYKIISIYKLYMLYFIYVIILPYCG